MAFETESPCAGFGRCAEHRERKSLGRALPRAVSACREHILQRHHIAGLLDAGGGKQRGEQVPCGRLLCRAHLLEPETGLDVPGSTAAPKSADPEITMLRRFNSVG